MPFAIIMLTTVLFAAEPAERDNGRNAGRNAGDFAFTAINGAPMPLSAYEGRALLVVNTASLCGFTHQYSGLQALYERYEAKGLTVIGVPSNDFGGQEPGANDDIKTFCKVNFNVRFPLTEKTVVKGGDAHPFYQWAAETLGDAARPKWNFHKILIGADGAAAAAFASSLEPDDPRMISAIESALPASVNP